MMVLISLLGPTSSGKSEMAVDLAQILQKLSFKVWIVSCDSRQIYKFLNLGTGKVAGSWQIKNNQKQVFIYKNIEHYLIDYKDPYLDFNFSLVQFITDFNNLFLDKENNPDFVILTGGTGLYAKAIIEKYDLYEVLTTYQKEADEYKNSLLQKKLQQLQEIYLKLKLPELNQSDFHNPRRLINKIYQEYIKKQGWVKQIKHQKFEKIYSFAIKTEHLDLKQKISTRLAKRLEQGLIQEVFKHQNLGFDKFLKLGLEYRLGYYYILGFITKNEFFEKLKIENFRYAKRQITWLKKQDLIWIKTSKEILKYLTFSKPFK
jgi:tRNA dimethylallyltransferase